MAIGEEGINVCPLSYGDDCFQRKRGGQMDLNGLHGTR